MVHYLKVMLIQSSRALDFLALHSGLIGSRSRSTAELRCCHLDIALRNDNKDTDIGIGSRRAQNTQASREGIRDPDASEFRTQIVVAGASILQQGPKCPQPTQQYGEIIKRCG